MSTLLKSLALLVIMTAPALAQQDDMFYRQRRQYERDQRLQERELERRQLWKDLGNQPERVLPKPRSKPKQDEPKGETPAPAAPRTVEPMPMRMQPYAPSARSAPTQQRTDENDPFKGLNNLLGDQEEPPAP